MSSFIFAKLILPDPLVSLLHRVSLVCEHLVYIITGTSVRYKGKKESRGQVLKFHNTWSLF